MPIPDFSLREASCVNAGKDVTFPTLQAVQLLEVHHGSLVVCIHEVLKNLDQTLLLW